MKSKKKKCLEKTPSTILRKIPILFGCFSKFFTPCLHLISPRQKIPLYNTEKNSSFVDVFLEKIYKLFSRKKGSPQIVGQTSSFILFIHQKCKGEYRKSYLQCRTIQGNMPQPFRATILFSYFSGTI